jgi:hypothetical protein
VGSLLAVRAPSQGPLRGARRKHSELQWRILRVLADLDPPWVLTGGGALAGFHLKHRRFVREMRVAPLAASLGWTTTEIDAIVRFQEWFVSRLLELARPTK